MQSYKYEMGQTLTAQPGGETGVVTARSEYAYAEPSYQLRFATGSHDGPSRRTVQEWFTESSLTSEVKSLE